jgi:hypothetical protein
VRSEVPWRRLLAEGVVIIVSVLVALAGDAWWDSRRDRAEEAELLASLDAELASNLEDLTQWRTGHERMEAVAADLLGRSGPAADAIDAATFDSLLAEALMWRTYHPSTGALRTAVSRMSLIRSEGLRHELSGFEERAQQLLEDYDWAVQEVADVILHVRDVVPLYTANNSRWTQANAGQDRTTLLRDVGFANALGLWVWRAGRMAETSDDLESNMLLMLDLVRNGLAP